MEQGIFNIAPNIRNKLRLSYSSILDFLFAFEDSLGMNVFVIDKKKLSDFREDNITKYESRSHSSLPLLLNPCAPKLECLEHPSSNIRSHFISRDTFVQRVTILFK